ncbi:hypothetical protein TREMEDRAFT_56918 [Tremella mesenterica DSM 1558]|uniref:uncharacterized protein n=1 Tax=Tremella mesenterica (strain ATCC 24925 / CBS 8224 / DSM 1558 / NBRC 9311 / NRRL Y-6157 / RJB 2259-6 / UBC 559-6) TaxID=578456 RepID=UPI0003F49B7D|nr:uncharacterized protein TREMEDRAFT_56918 [Tremella mesenterica DSM 1558]EIW69435.1 hypothetical protein TREMEDRAFT_56918 [Tremella mesenterica DSM 1558]
MAGASNLCSLSLGEAVSSAELCVRGIPAASPDPTRVRGRRKPPRMVGFTERLLGSALRV